MLVATRRSEVGAAVLDWQTPLHFGVGAFAGSLGINPHVAAVIFIGLRTLNLAVEDGLGHALFSTEHGQSHANEMADLLSEFVGLYVGGKARQMITGQSPTHGLGGKIVGNLGAPGGVAQQMPQPMRSGTQAPRAQVAPTRLGVPRVAGAMR